MNAAAIRRAFIFLSPRRPAVWVHNLQKPRLGRCKVGPRKLRTVSLPRQHSALGPRQATALRGSATARSARPRLLHISLSAQWANGSAHERALKGGELLAGAGAENGADSPGLAGMQAYASLQAKLSASPAAFPLPSLPSLLFPFSAFSRNPRLCSELRVRGRSLCPWPKRGNRKQHIRSGCFGALPQAAALPLPQGAPWFWLPYLRKPQAAGCYPGATDATASLDVGCICMSCCANC